MGKFTFFGAVLSALLESIRKADKAALSGPRKVYFWVRLWDGSWPRSLCAFLKCDVFEQLIQRCATHKQIYSVEMDKGIVEHPYQIRTIRRADNTFDFQ